MRERSAVSPSLNVSHSLLLEYLHHCPCLRIISAVTKSLTGTGPTKFITTMIFGKAASSLVHVSISHKLQLLTNRQHYKTHSAVSICWKIVNQSGLQKKATLLQYLYAYSTLQGPTTGLHHTLKCKEEMSELSKPVTAIPQVQAA